MKRKVGIIGGTFDPIHNGHLMLAEYSRVNFKLEEIIFMPSGNPPHKEKGIVSPIIHRYNMTLLAINSNPHFVLSTLEIKKEEEINYTVDTIKKLKEINKNIDYYFILGEDSIKEIHTWKDYNKLLRMCKFIVAPRPYSDRKTLMDKVNSLNVKYGHSIYILDMPLIEISSTDIRNRVSKGLSIKYLVPEIVEMYIQKHKLYI
ncbi:nicotinate-nucleotide adenylyltransferase [Caproiciproducens sp. MSJ-32]|uniref:nicotinate-nucleotide adenylyltransferase n=1 Tax=Caproiciproducens sp. MSJ-32 TaxID=2841527 RepID=UPI001C11671C|nr:nicotinate-nucleotide adenylyltransferase [Caproiciproducens sp. MSJ-32]MBU5455465.1 nicotinate-nucleotide adenylyltransferase [Caproiciproducens sp. MSJ-32]